MKAQYTIAIASDLHSNLTALRTWINHSLKQPIDEIYLLGDFVSDFPHPQDTLNELYEVSKKIPTTFIRGNREDYFLNPDKNWKPSTQSGSLYHTNKLLRTSDLSFFASLPSVQHIKFPDAPSLLLAHGSPKNNREHLPPASTQLGGYLQAMEEDFLITAHTHRPCIELQRNKCYINPGSIGYNIVSTKGSYATITYQNDTWLPKLHFFSYDRKLEQRRIIETGFLDDAKYWGVASWLNLETGMDINVALLTEAYRLSNHQPPLEEHFVKAAKNLNFPSIDEIKQLK